MQYERNDDDVPPKPTEPPEPGREWALSVETDEVAVLDKDGVVTRYINPRLTWVQLTHEEIEEQQRQNEIADAAVDESLDLDRLAEQHGFTVVFHSVRFRKVANGYPRIVAAAYDGDLVAAAADSDEQVARRVAEYESREGGMPRDWWAIGRSERDEDTEGEG